MHPGRERATNLEVSPFQKTPSDTTALSYSMPSLPATPVSQSALGMDQRVEQLTASKPQAPQGNPNVPIAQRAEMTPAASNAPGRKLPGAAAAPSSHYPSLQS